MSKLIIYFCIIISTSYGLIYNIVRSIKENKNSMWIYYTNISNVLVLIYIVLTIISLFNNNFILKKFIGIPSFEKSFLYIKLRFSFKTLSFLNA